MVSLSSIGDMTALEVSANILHFSLQGQIEGFIKCFPFLFAFSPAFLCR